MGSDNDISAIIKWADRCPGGSQEGRIALARAEQEGTTVTATEGGS
jgi:hypothetical protein